MEPLAVFPDPPSRWLSRALASAGYPYEPVAGAAEVERCEPAEGWAGAVVEMGTDGAGISLCRALRKREEQVSPVLVAVTDDQLAELDFDEGLFDDFVLVGSAALEVEARLAQLFRRLRRGTEHEIIQYGPLALNLATYQAALDGRPLDLTYMEYELLRFLAAHPGKVFTREALLQRVWGYEYFGGARTVDVHVRRLRAKLGEEHAHLIETVRSVGYRFGSVRWLPEGRVSDWQS